MVIGKLSAGSITGYGSFNNKFDVTPTTSINSLLRDDTS